MFVALFALIVGCGGPDTQLQPAVVEWMEWPAEVLQNTPFTVRLVVWQQGCGFGAFRPGVSADQSAVTFSPYFLLDKKNIICEPAVQVTAIAFLALDTSGTAPGLAAPYARTFDMRAASVVATPSSAADPAIRTFGTVVVRPASPDSSRTDAAGTVYTSVDSAGCARIRPLGLYSPTSYRVLDNPADTTGLNGAFVRGYIYQPAAPICGETRVFHLVARN
ncbi:MAG TPA: hypothetical protein VKQ05_08275 [Gemmatimonadales bacterium]|nr:hypothetical protein [Gemmatimonadales bacterium]